MICKLMNFNFEESIVLSPENFGQDSSYFLNSSKIRSEVLWNDKVSLEKGIKETIRWGEKNWNILSKLPDYYKHTI